MRGDRTGNMTGMRTCRCGDGMKRYKYFPESQETNKSPIL